MSRYASMVAASRRRGIAAIVAFAVVSALAAGATIKAGPPQRAVDPAGELLVFQDAAGNTVAVPLSVVRVTFAEWKTDDEPPVTKYQQVLLGVQRALASELQAHRACEGALGPLQASQHAQQLEGQQQTIDDMRAKAAPAGKVWDKDKGKYVDAPKTPAVKK